MQKRPNIKHFNIVDPARDDFEQRIVSEGADAEKRPQLIAYVRKLIERGTITAPVATRTKTSAELAEAGFVGLLVTPPPGPKLVEVSDGLFKIDDGSGRHIAVTK